MSKRVTVGLLIVDWDEGDEQYVSHDGSIEIQQAPEGWSLIARFGIYHELRLACTSSTPRGALLILRRQMRAIRDELDVLC